MRKAERGALTTERAVGLRLVGATCFWQGDFSAARANLAEALSIYDPKPDREAMFRFGLDIGATAGAFLTVTKWLLREVGPPRALIEEAVAHATEIGQVGKASH